MSVLRSKFESEERHQEAEYVNDLIQKEAEKQEQESEFIPAAGAPTTTTIEAEEIAKITTNEPALTAATTTTTSSMKPSPTQQQKGGQETVSSKSLSKQLDKQTIQINKGILSQQLPTFVNSTSLESVKVLLDDVSTALKTKNVNSALIHLNLIDQQLSGLYTPGNSPFTELEFGTIVSGKVLYVDYSAESAFPPFTFSILFSIYDQPIVCIRSLLEFVCQ